MGVMKMNEKERLRKAIFEMVNQKRITLAQACVQCDLSYRQAHRIYERYKKDGDAGLIHQSRGQRSNRKHPHQEAIIARYIERYEGFGPTLAAEYLLEEGYDINRETLRLWLLSNDLWKKKHKRSPFRKRREPKAQFGELVQIDGSIHDWFGIEKNDCLLNIVDDATNKTLAMLDSGETTRVVFLALWKWIKRYGIPLAIYVDLKTVYVSPKDTSFSHVQVACEKLGIRIIKARSPQAKGRVERNHAVYQDRFVKELYLRQIKTIYGGNSVLDSGFIDNLNRKFEKPARNPESAHRPLGHIDLNQVFCWEYERQVQHDWTFSFSGKYFQVQKEYGSHVKPKDKIKVRKHLDGMISIWYKEEKLAAIEIPKRPPPESKIQIFQPKPINSKKIVNHPTWRESNSFAFLPKTKRQSR
jgi:transposase